ncbi:unnamed protein product [Rangifer tarandus platyrhynchus]|uniref:Uncharacterized protein n=2 Tax=Rangifer tarandus platyrhynchus TaxID=3082113 RepID=A0ABN8ZQK1_RANTA|nr:unnamed protein product [Rangifer tarandus platyrhynchus]
MRGEGLRLQGAGHWVPRTCRRLLTCLCSQMEPLVRFQTRGRLLLLPEPVPTADPLHSHVAPCLRQLCSRGPPPGCAPISGRSQDVRKGEEMTRTGSVDLEPETAYEKKRVSHGMNGGASE